LNFSDFNVLQAKKHGKGPESASKCIGDFRGRGRVADCGGLWYQYESRPEGLKDAAPRFKGEVILRVSFMATILCDIGGVLIDVDYRPALEGLSKECGLREEAIYERMFGSGLKERHDEGKISSYEFYSAIVPEERISFGRFEDLWSGIFSEKKEVIDFISSLGKRYRLLTASNIDSIHFDFCYNNYKWLAVFEGMGLSYKLGYTKPARGFFERLCDQFGIEAGGAVLIDDTEENIKGAEDFGIKGHLFRGTAGLKGFLKDF